MNESILCIDDDPELLLCTRNVLKNHFQVATAQNWLEAESLLQKNFFDFVLLDIHINSSEPNGLDILQNIKSLFPKTEVIMLSGDGNPKIILDAIQRGAADYFIKPCTDEVIITIRNVQKNRQLQDKYESLLETAHHEKISQFFLGTAPNFLKVLQDAQKLKSHFANVLIEGESGTGKELLARLLHSNEANAQRPFIAVNCAAIPDNLLESELFGHEKGSFSGAHEKKIGKFELANNGDIFLDEVNSLKPELQSKLLRALQEKEFYRVGGSRPIQVNFRTITATNVSLKEMAKKGLFREDLFHRLCVVSLKMPALRERKSDIPLLIDFFLKKFCKDIQTKTFSESALSILKNYPWPGNIRELENIVYSLVILTTHNRIELSDLPIWILENPKNREVDFIENPVQEEKILTHENINKKIEKLFHLPMAECMQAVRKIYIERVVQSNSGNISKTAKQIGVSRQRIHSILKSHEAN